MRIQEIRDECKKWAEVAAKAKEEVTEQQNLIGELRTNIVEKDTRLDQLQKKNDELSTLLSQAKEDAVAEFKASKEYTDRLDEHYAAGFEDFRIDAMENFLEVYFSSIKLNLATATSSLLQASSKDVNVEDDATTQLSQDDPNINAPLLKSFDYPLYFLFSFDFCLVLSFGTF